MNSSKFNIILLFFVSLLFSCDSISKQTGFKVIEVEAGNEVQTVFPTQFSIDGYLKFYSNGFFTYLEKEGTFYRGKWEENDNKMYFKFDFEKNATGYHKANLEDNWLKLVSIDSIQQVKYLIREDGLYEHDDIDLLSEERNWWRIKPIKKETQKELEKRVVAQLDYLIRYFELVERKKIGKFSYEYLNSPIAFYSNGIGVISIEEQKQQWVNIFYDLKDAEKALKILSNSLKSMSEYPSDKESYTKGYRNAFEKMKKYIEN